MYSTPSRKRTRGGGGSSSLAKKTKVAKALSSALRTARRAAENDQCVMRKTGEYAMRFITDEPARSWELVPRVCVANFLAMQEGYEGHLFPHQEDPQTAALGGVNVINDYKGVYEGFTNLFQKDIGGTHCDNQGVAPSIPPFGRISEHIFPQKLKLNYTVNWHYGSKGMQMRVLIIEYDRVPEQEDNATKLPRLHRLFIGHGREGANGVYKGNPKDSSILNLHNQSGADAPDWAGMTVPDLMTAHVERDSEIRPSVLYDKVHTSNAPGLNDALENLASGSRAALQFIKPEQGVLEVSTDPIAPAGSYVTPSVLSNDHLDKGLPGQLPPTVLTQHGRQTVQVLSTRELHGKVLTQQDILDMTAVAGVTPQRGAMTRSYKNSKLHYHSSVLSNSSSEKQQFNRTAPLRRNLMMVTIMGNSILGAYAMDRGVKDDTDTYPEYKHNSESFDRTTGAPHFGCRATDTTTFAATAASHISHRLRSAYNLAGLDMATVHVQSEFRYAR